MTFGSIAAGGNGTNVNVSANIGGAGAGESTTSSLGSSSWEHIRQQRRGSFDSVDQRILSEFAGMKNNTYEMKAGDTVWDLAEALKGKNHGLKDSTPDLSKSIMQEAHIGNPQTVPVGYEINVSQWMPQPRQADAKASDKPEAIAEAKAVAKAGDKPEAIAEAKADTKASDKPEATAEAKAGEKPEAKAEAKAGEATATAQAEAGGAAALQNASQPQKGAEPADGKFAKLFEQTKQNIAKADKDQDGVISSEEYAAPAKSDKDKGVLVERFKVVDQDHDGKLNVAELSGFELFKSNSTQLVNDFIKAKANGEQAPQPTVDNEVTEQDQKQAYQWLQESPELAGKVFGNLLSSLKLREQAETAEKSDEPSKSEDAAQPVTDSTRTPEASSSDKAPADKDTVTAASALANDKTASAVSAVLSNQPNGAKALEMALALALTPKKAQPEAAAM